MKSFVLPVPIFNPDMSVHAYLFLYQKYENLMPGGQVFNLFDGSFNNQVLELLDKLGVDAFTNGLPVIVPISNINLLVDLEQQCHVPAKQIIFLIDQTVTPEENYLRRIYRFRGLGYKFALSITDHFEDYDAVMEIMDYIFIDQGVFDKMRIPMSVLRYDHLKIAATGIKYYPQFHWAQHHQYNLFEGSFYRMPVVFETNQITPLKVNAIRLLNLVQADDFHIDAVSEIVRADTSLAISLLRMVNSPHLGLSQKIRTINQAAALLGQRELRKWVTTAVASSLAADKPTEINRLSLIRAKFCENIASLYHLEEDSQSLFLMGLFSILDVVLDMDLADAFRHVAVADEISNALVHKTGPFYPVFEIVTLYENADFQAISRLAILNNLDVGAFTDAYLEAVQWYSDLIHVDVETSEILQ